MNPTGIMMLSLRSIPGVGARVLNKFLAWARESGQPLSAITSLPAAELRQLFRLRDEIITAIQATTPEQGQAIVDQLATAGHTLILRGEVGYPALLETRLAENAPPFLTVLGNIDSLSAAGVAFSGSRRTSPDGIQHARNLAKQAVARSLTVISGHAPGTDLATHQAALQNGGVTVLVLPEGALRFRPHADLIPFMESERVVVVSEFPPNMPWSAQNAMIRNQTIIGLARALIVIEAGEEGGTLDAGRRAISLKIPVYALAGLNLPPSAAGNTLLHAEGATPLPVDPSPILPTTENPPPSVDPHPLPTQLDLF